MLTPLASLAFTVGIGAPPLDAATLSARNSRLIKQVSNLRDIKVVACGDDGHPGLVLGSDNPKGAVLEEVGDVDARVIRQHCFKATAVSVGFNHANSLGGFVALNELMNDSEAVLIGAGRGDDFSLHIYFW